MKNSLNIVIVVFIFIVLGCSCPSKLTELQKSIEGSSKKPSNSVSNTAAKPAKEDSDAGSSNLTMAKYSEIKNGMSYKQVKEIIGSEGTETTSSGEGKYKVMSFQWKDEGFAFLSIVLVGDKVTSKTQANLK